MVTIISLGGSIVAPDGIDADFVRRFVKLITEYLEGHGKRKIILIVGGGAPARRYQAAYRQIRGESADLSSDDQDWIGIMATRLNAELIRACFPGSCKNPVVYDPVANFGFDGSVLVAAGWKPGFSTDFDAVMFAERFSAQRLINLSNIEKVYSADPRVDPDAVPLDFISWRDFRKMVGNTWEPGKNLPFDPVASKRAQDIDLRVIAAGVGDLDNVRNILQGGEFVGTTIASSRDG